MVGKSTTPTAHECNTPPATTTTSTTCSAGTYPERIVCLLPSITEIVASLGVADQIVGITHECDYPPEAVANATVVTTSEIRPYEMSQDQINEAVCGSLRNGDSLYGLDRDALRSVRPDVVFTQSLCDVCAVSYPMVLDTCARLMTAEAEPTSSSASSHSMSVSETTQEDKTALQRFWPCDPKVISMEPTNLKEVIKTIHVAARTLVRPELQIRADAVTLGMERGLETIRRVVQASTMGRRTTTTTTDHYNENHRPSVAFLEWHEPLFTGGHWIPDMLEVAGGAYTMCPSGERSAIITDEEFVRLDADVILVGPCGFSLDRALRDTLAMYNKKPWWKDLRAVQEGRVFALDGNSYYARPGPRLLQGTGIMATCIHGENVGKELGEELAPSSGYHRITMDMYETS